jgi:hypothetical protein
VSYVGRYLLGTDKEREVFATRRHWMALASVGITFLAFWAGGFLVLGLSKGVGLPAMVAVCFLFFSLCWFFWFTAQWYVEVFVVTDRRVLLVSGLLTRRVAIMPLRKVTDLTFEQTAPGRLLEYGSFILESAGQQQALARIDYLPRPQHHYQQVAELLFGSKAEIDPDDGGPDNISLIDGPSHPDSATAPLPRVPGR